ncbi:MAG TPA: hypothetical protein VL614_09525 [Acetobacteraceae bacterium]|nr:hypothetical protein [Acetobacteraceae bacterium]
MKTMILAAAAVLSLGMSAAFADGGEGPVANTQFTELPGVIAQGQTGAGTALAQSPTGNGAALFVTGSHPVAQPFPWNPNEGVGG